MKIGTKLFLALAAAVLLALVSGWLGSRYASASPTARPVLLGLMGLAALAVLAIGGAVVKWIWLPVKRLARTAREVSGGNHQGRLPLALPGELKDLAVAFNHLLDTMQNEVQARAALEQSRLAQIRELEQRLDGLTLELRASQRGHAALLANMPGMVCRRRNDRDWTLEFVSAGCRDLLGTAPEDFTAGHSPFLERIHPEDRERVWFAVQTAIARQNAFTLEYRVKHANGHWVQVGETGWAVSDPQGRITALEGQVTDLTSRMEGERKRRVMEIQLRRAQKMETIGTLAGGVAHNFNNVLAGILGSAELIKMDMDPDHPAREFLDQIFMAGNRAREVVQQVLSFSQWRENERIVIQLQPVVRECVKLLRSTIPAMVNISCQIDPDCSPVLADPTQMHQVIMNLCTSVWKALPGTNGHIRVNLSQCEIKETVAAGQPGLPAGPGVRLSIYDHNRGQHQSAQECLFEPFATVKPDTDGVSLGLSIVHGIVRDHQGVFTVKSEPGKGMDFHIYLPTQAIAKADWEEATVFSKNHERILLVDDDDIAGRTTEQILQRFGYQVRWFKIPEEALTEFQARPQDYDLVVSDLAMPGLTGRDLAAALRRLRPDLPILITTGMIDPAILKQAHETGLGKVLFKPVSPATLAREIARQLDDQVEI